MHNLEAKFFLSFLSVSHPVLLSLSFSHFLFVLFWYSGREQDEQSWTLLSFELLWTNDPLKVPVLLVSVVHCVVHYPVSEKGLSGEFQRVSRQLFFFFMNLDRVKIFVKETLRYNPHPLCSCRKLIWPECEHRRVTYTPLSAARVKCSRVNLAWWKSIWETDFLSIQS